MTGRLFSYQIFWKEYRQMRGFWLSVFAMTVMLQVTICFVPVNPLADQLYGLAACFSVLYALGCGATMFAVEHENGTYEFLRALPTKGLPTFVSKAAFTVVSAPLLVIATLISGAILALSRDLYRLAPMEYLALWAIGSILLFVWAAFFSLLMRHAIKAALLGGCAAAITVPFLGFLHEVLIGLRSEPSMIAAYVAVVAVVSALDVWLGIRWYREPSTWRGAGSRARRHAELAETGTLGLEETPARISKLGHLAWLQWRQSRGMLLIFSAILALCVVTFPFFYLPMFAAAIVVPIAGANVFAGDQKQYQFRFFADRGLSPKSVWWSRHSVWLAAILIWTAIAALPLAWMVTHWTVRGPQDAYYVIWMVVRPAILCIPLAYCFGQFCSMMVRSGILCGTCSIVGSILLGLWAFAMSIIDVPLFWSVLPIPVILLVATRVRTRRWLLEDNSLKSWLPVALVVTLPAVAILSGVCMYRVYSLPLVEPGFDVATFVNVSSSPEGQDTAKMYRRALDVAAGETTEATKQEALALVLEASRRPQCDALSKHFPVKYIESTERLAALLRHEGNRLEKQGDLDGALEFHLAALRAAAHAYMDPAIMPWAERMESMALANLVDWSTQPGQTKKRILEALRAVEDVTRNPIPFDNVIKDEYVQLTEVIDGDMNDMFQWVGRDPRANSALMIYWMPWERQRARRLIRLMASRELHTYQEIQTGINLGRQIPEYLVQAWHQPHPSLQYPQWWHMAPDAWLHRSDCSWVTHHAVTTELSRRSARIQMALAAWQLDHESLPESLKELSNGYLTKVPLDPYSGESFAYFPNGVSEPLKRYHETAGEMTVVLETGKPFFWSSGSNVLIGENFRRGMLPSPSNPMQKYSVRFGTEWQRAASPEQIWAAGRVFPIPQPR